MDHIYQALCTYVSIYECKRKISTIVLLYLELIRILQPYTYKCMVL